MPARPMNPRRRFYMPSVVVAVVAAVALSGAACNRQPLPDGMPSLVSVTLTFTQEGKPLPDATVTLHPEDPQSPWNAGGTTGANGEIAPATQGRYVGVVPGKYKITVTKTEESAGAAASARPDAFHLVDPKYATSATTTLDLDVTPQQRTASFDLGAPVREKIIPSYP